MKRFMGIVLLIALQLGAAVGWLVYGAGKKTAAGENWTLNLELSAEEWQMQENLALWYNLNLSNSDEGMPSNSYGQILFLEDGIMCSIEFPQVGKELPVWHGAREKHPMGLTHLPDSALPVGGKGNHTVLTCKEAGISGMALPEKEDHFILHTMQNKITYRVCDVDTSRRKPTAPRAEAEKDLCSIWIRRERDWVIIRGVRVDP